MNTQNKSGTAVVTGASSGIGAVYAARLAQRGFNLVLVARDWQKLQDLAERLQRETGVNVEVLTADLTQKVDLVRVEARLRQEDVTVLVNNAGMSIKTDIVDIDPEQLEQMIALNVLAPSRLAAAVLPGLLARNRGTLINISSVLALAPEMFNGAYSGTKAYVLNLSLNLQQKVKGTSVKVQAVLPGATRTEIWSKSGTDIAAMPQEMLMDVDEMVDAALAGLDQGEAITIPALPDVGEWQAATAARLKMAPHLSLQHAAARYR
ncbi:MAG: SDR family oxidoreductase [Pedobacter sp.]|nr:SDR family oxidoreductase [Pedobacter sp.]